MNHSSKAKIAVPYSMGLGGAKAPQTVSPKAAVEAEAHYSKVQATRRWIEGNMSTKEHDATHRRADAVLKNHGKRP